MNSFGNNFLILASADNDFQEATLDGSSIHDLYERAMNELQSLGFVAAARFFSRPEKYKSPGTNQIIYSWFGWTKSQARPMGHLGVRERETVANRLGELLAELRLAAERSTFIKSFLEGALVLGDDNSILEIEMRPVLVGWGLAPRRVIRDEISFEIHVEATIGPFLPTGLTVSRRWFDGAADANRTQGGSSPGHAARIVESQEDRQGLDLTIQLGGDHGDCPPAWRWPAALLAFVLSLLGYASWPGNLLYSDTVVAAGGQAQETIDALRQRVGQLQAALSSPDACSVDPALRRQPLTAPPLAPGNLPGATNEPAHPPAAPAGVDPSGVQAAEAANPAPATEGRSLLELMDQGTVFVIAAADGKAQMGSGFFVDRQHVLTNFHVIEGADPTMTIVVNKKLGVKKVRVVASTQTAVIGKEDFALLALDADADVAPLGLATQVERLDPIIAAGYPAFAIDSDEAYQRAANGDMEALRQIQLVVTQGNVTTFTTFDTDRKIIAHSAQTSPGNSGGPLLDECGRVVGVNTFVRSGGELNIHLNYALPAQSAAEFLAAHGVQPQLGAAACRPPVSAASAAQSTQQ